MKLFKLLLIIFGVYFVRRFFQLMKVMKEIQQNQRRENNYKTNENKKQSDHSIVDAEFRVIDR
jgi:hypothetical protein